MSVLEPCVMYDRRVLTPSSLWQEVLKGIHVSHQGVVSMSNRAQQVVFWLGIFKDLETVRATCRDCCIRAPLQPAMPPAPSFNPEYPFHMLVADYCDIKGKTWLVTADRFIGWTSVFYFPGTASSKELIKVFRVTVTTFGVPQEITMDGGPQFTSHDLVLFLEKWGVHHTNLRAETAVKSAKRILSSNTKSDGSPNWESIKRSVLQHRNTPVPDLALSLAQMLYGRPIRDHLPVKPGLFFQPSEVWLNCQRSSRVSLTAQDISGWRKMGWTYKIFTRSKARQNVFIQNQ